MAYPDLSRSRPVRAAGMARSSWSNLLFVLPFLLLYAGLLVYPLIQGMWMSLHDYDLLSGESEFLGLTNFIKLFKNNIFLGSVRNTLWFVVMSTPTFVVLGLALALALNRASRAGAVLRFIFFGSSVLSVTIVTLVWRMVLRPDRGLIANVLDWFGLPPVPFLIDVHLALPSIAGVTVWWGVGLPMMLFLAALQQIPQEIYEAAKLDNAGWWRTLFSITLPSIKRSVILVAVIEIVLQFQLFGQAQIMTQGGPNNSSRPIVLFIYESGFRDWRLGYAAAAAQILFFLMLVAASFQLWLGRRGRGGAA